MDKVVDLNEKALEKEKKDFNKMCRFFEMLATVFRTLIMICVPILLVFYIISALGWVDIGEDFRSAEGLITTIALSITCIGYVIALNFGAKIFKTVRTAETPFRYDVSDKMKGAGLALIVTGILGFILNVLVRVLMANSTLYFDTMTYMPDTVPFLFGVFLLALAYIFNYGCKLQQEADETI